MADRAIDGEIVNVVAVPIIDVRIFPGARHARVDTLVGVLTPRAMGEAHQHIRKLVGFVLVVEWRAVAAASGGIGGDGTRGEL